jgi:folate-binding protein YgfZ
MSVDIIARHHELSRQTAHFSRYPMNPGLESALQSLGANVADGIVQAFGDAGAELLAVRDGTYAADLSQFGVLSFTGADATEFLQGQLSCDVKSLGRTKCSLGSYCTPKGRMLASFLLWPHATDGWRMLLHASVLAGVHKRLKMFVLRSKVVIADDSTRLSLMGVGGAASADALHNLLPALPAPPTGELLAIGDTEVIPLQGSRWLVAAPADQGAALWVRIPGLLRPVGSPAWDWSDIRNGITYIRAQTQEQFVPQMANLELIGGVSFKKGCYPGQEIVARTQHIGQVKRRLYLAHVDDVVQPGESLHGEDVEGQANGMVASAAPAPGGGSDILAVIQRTSAESSRVHLRGPDGPLLAFQPLPYAIP